MKTFSPKTKRLLVFCCLLSCFAWGRIFWITLSYISPPQRTTYIFSKDSVLKEGYPHTSFPYFIEKDLVWKFADYSRNQNNERKGFILFDLNKGKTYVKWAFPKENDHIDILGALKNPDGNLVIMYGVGEKAKIAFLQSNGSVVVEEFPFPRHTIRGWAWVNGCIEIAAGIDNLPLSMLYRYENKEWKKHVVRWSSITDLTGKESRTLIAFYQGSWNFLVTVFSQKEFYSGKDINYPIYQLTDKSRMDLITEIKEQPSFVISNFDRTMGNLLPETFAEKLYSYDKAKITLLTSGQQDLDKRCYPQTFILEANKMKNVLGWGKTHFQPIVEQYPFGDFQFIYKDSTYTLGNQNSVFLQKGSSISNYPLSSSYRFSTNNVIVPSSDGNMWVLGTFGHYVKVSQNLIRKDSLGIPQRLIHSSKQFFSRDTYYDDFLLYYGFLKTLALPTILFLFFLPIGLLILCRSRNEKLYVAVGWLYLLSFCAFFVWFWRISFGI